MIDNNAIHNAIHCDLHGASAEGVTPRTVAVTDTATMNHDGLAVRRMNICQECAASLPVGWRDITGTLADPERQEALAFALLEEWQHGQEVDPAYPGIPTFNGQRVRPERLPAIRERVNELLGRDHG